MPSKTGPRPGTRLILVMGSERSDARQTYRIAPVTATNRGADQLITLAEYLITNVSLQAPALPKDSPDQARRRSRIAGESNIHEIAAEVRVQHDKGVICQNPGPTITSVLARRGPANSIPGSISPGEKQSSLVFSINNWTALHNGTRRCVPALEVLRSQIRVQCKEHRIVGRERHLRRRG